MNSSVFNALHALLDYAADRGIMLSDYMDAQVTEVSWCGTACDEDVVSH